MARLNEVMPYEIENLGRPTPRILCKDACRQSIVEVRGGILRRPGQEGILCCREGRCRVTIKVPYLTGLFKCRLAGL